MRSHSKTIDDLFQSIYGKPCWQAQQGVGSFLTFEFGEPHLRIREPRKLTSGSTKLRKLNAKRLVTLRGDWHLWIYLCNWRIYSKKKILADSQSSRPIIKQATLELDGQYLVKASLTKSLTTVFEFDLGGKLETMPSASEEEATLDELWMLYEPSGVVFTLRADGHYSHMPGNTIPEEEYFQALDFS